jgi:hypothetical protein
MPEEEEGPTGWMAEPTETAGRAASRSEAVAGSARRPARPRRRVRSARRRDRSRPSLHRRAPQARGSAWRRPPRSGWWHRRAAVRPYRHARCRRRIAFQGLQVSLQPTSWRT